MDHLILAFALAFGIAATPVAARQHGEPLGCRLAGTVTLGNSERPFEIVMEGADRYYCLEGTIPSDAGCLDLASSYTIHLVVGKFAGARSQSWSPQSGGRGGGNYSQDGKVRTQVARRLWAGAKFVGVDPASLGAAREGDHYVEQFLEPANRAGYRVPSSILWTDNTSSMPEKTSRYVIRKVEFRYDRDPKFFDEARARHFPEAAKD